MYTNDSTQLTCRLILTSIAESPIMENHESCPTHVYLYINKRHPCYAVRNKQQNNNMGHDIYHDDTDNVVPISYL